MNIDDLKYKIDRELTLFHFRRADKLIHKGLAFAKSNEFTGLECYFMGELAMMREDFKTAVMYFKLALRENDQDYCSWNDLGISYGELGMYSSAFRAFDSGLKVNNNHRPLYQNKGWIYTLIHDFDNAHIYFSKALELDPHSPESLFSCGHCFLEKGEFAAALRLFHKALKEVQGKSSFAVKEINRFIKQIENK